jgi:hypothetical protein
MSLLALAAVTVLQVGGAHGGVVTDGALIYQGDAGARGTFERLELDSGARTRLYTAPDRRTAISGMDAGGGRAAFETTSRQTRIFTMGATGANLQELAHGRDYDYRDCGRALDLLDVSSSGEVLYDDVAVPCATHRGRRSLRAFSPATGTRTLSSHPARSVFLSFGPPFRQLAGDQLVTWGPRLVRVRNLATDRVRRFRVPDRLTTFREPAVAEDGRILLDRFRSMGRDRPPRQTIRLVSPSGGPKVVHRTRHAFGQARFCGDRPVLQTFTLARRLRLSLLEPRVLVFDGLMPRRDLDASCDARHFALLTVGRDEGELVYVHELPR